MVVALPQFSESAAAWAMEAGADEFLSPPFNSGEVLARIAVLLRLRQDQQAIQESSQKFSQLFQETSHPLLFSRHNREACEINPALWRFLGYSDKSSLPPPLTVEELLYGPEDWDAALLGTETPNMRNTTSKLFKI